jgi:hypothetical protein
VIPEQDSIFQRFLWLTETESVPLSCSGTVFVIKTNNISKLSFLVPRGGVPQVNKLNYLGKSGTLKTFRIVLMFSFSVSHHACCAR